MPTIDIEKVLIPERACRCGSRYFVAIPRGQTEPRTFHLKPLCPQIQRMTGIDFLRWNNTGEEDLSKLPKPPKLNRRARRKVGHIKREQARQAQALGVDGSRTVGSMQPNVDAVLERVRALTAAAE